MPVSCNDPENTAGSGRVQPKPSTLPNGVLFWVCSQCTSAVVAKIWSVISCQESRLFEFRTNFCTCLAWGTVTPLGTLTGPGSQPRPTPVRWSMPKIYATNTLNYDWNDPSIFWSMSSSCPPQVSFSTYSSPLKFRQVQWSYAVILCL